VAPGAFRVAPRAPVFGISAAAIAAVLVFALSATELAERWFLGLQDWIAATFGWFYVLSVTFFLGFALWLALSRHGDVRLGPDGSRPRYGYLAWFAMLFSAGMGIGILFYGVAEPILHYQSPPPFGGAGTGDAVRTAMRVSFFHWGLHAWAIYVCMGLALAYFHFRKGLPLSPRSPLEPLLGDRIRGPIGTGVDVLAVFGTLFGLATSLGLGAMQINAGLAHLFGAPHSVAVQVGLIAVITLCATLSLVAGLDKGIKRLSVLNLCLAGTLLAFVFATGPTLFLLESLPQHIGTYLHQIIQTSLRTDPMQDASWKKSWTLFYWAWWIAWAPFVGTFVARVSRGRTVREFVLGVMLVPSAVTFVWFTVFGGTALHLEILGGGGIADAVSADVSTAIYEMLARLPLGTVTSLLAVVVVATFFVTSSDSGSFVVDMLTSGGHPDPPVWQRVFWATMEGAVAAVLLVTGGLAALQSAAIITGLPFGFVLILVCVGLARALHEEEAEGR